MKIIVYKYTSKIAGINDITPGKVFINVKGIIMIGSINKTIWIAFI